MRNRIWRKELVSFALRATRARCYLEIGTLEGDLFNRVAAPLKIAVDPRITQRVADHCDGETTQCFEMTSDAFFARHEGLLSEAMIDVAFIDGLHTYEQVSRDVANCLRYLRPGGVILCHDCNPATAAMAIPAACYEDAMQGVAQGDHGEWTPRWSGDVWKAIVELRSSAPDLRVRVLDADTGVGVITRHPAGRERVRSTPLQLSPEQIAALDYDDLQRDRRALLGLVRPLYLPWILRRQRG